MADAMATVTMVGAVIVLMIFAYMVGSAVYEVVTGATVSDATKAEIADTLQLAR